jgi:hypothetical protein
LFVLSKKGSKALSLNRWQKNTQKSEKKKHLPIDLRKILTCQFFNEQPCMVSVFDSMETITLN